MYCIWVCPYVCHIASIDLIFLHKNIITVARSSKMTGLKKGFKNSSPSKYAMMSKVCWMKTCVMSSHVHCYDRGSVISDRLVIIISVYIVDCLQSILESFSRLLSFTILNCSFKLQSLLDICYLCNRAFSKVGHG